VSVPGIVDPETGHVGTAPDLGWDRTVPLRDTLHAYADVPIVVENDVNLMVAGERVHGAARGCDDVVLVYVGEGIGAGIVLRGTLLTGRHGVSNSKSEDLNRRFLDAWRSRSKFDYSQAAWFALVQETFGRDSGTDSEALFSDLYQRFARADAWTVFPDVLPTLENLLSRGVRLGIVSNWDERLRRHLEDAYAATSREAQRDALRRLVADARDGHGNALGGVLNAATGRT
jgi:phosphoglycolate phosphatase-like HAD superfamily hydrolase